MWRMMRAAMVAQPMRARTNRIVLARKVMMVMAIVSSSSGPPRSRMSRVSCSRSMSSCYVP